MLYIFSIFDLIPYILLILACAIAYNRRRVNFIFTVMLLFSCIRYGIGYDYPEYYRIITDTANFNYSRMELLTKSIVDISRYIDYPQFFFIINSICFLCPLLYVSKKVSINPSYSLLVVLLFPFFYLESLSIVRNSSAYSLVFLGYYFFLNKKYALSIFWGFVATGFHKSAYIFILIYLISIIPISSRISKIVPLVSLILVVIPLSSIILKVISILPFAEGFIPVHYFESGKEQGLFLRYLIPFFGFLLSYKWNYLRAHIVYPYAKLSLFGVLLWGLLSVDHTLSLRISSFCLIGFIIVLPYLKSNFLSISLNNFKVNFITMLLICVFTLLFAVNIIKYTPSMENKISFLPYQTIFKNIEYKNYQ